MVLLILSAAALAGYGDPVDGVPSPIEREVHLWTNAVRADPEAFRSDYPCNWSSFSPDQQEPQKPLLWNDDLGEAARYHSEDMHETGVFSHSSSDGTSFERRISRYYDGPGAGENIANGYADAYDVVVRGWMCSPGHRANLMASDWEELGTGVSGRYYTQDFGLRGIDVGRHPLAMGAHQRRGGDVDLLVSFFHSKSPERIEAVINGEPKKLALRYGTRSNGVFGTTVPDDGGCTTYYFRANLAGGGSGRFPEEGEYGFGGCSFDDREAGWVAGRGPTDKPSFPWPEDTDADHWGVLDEDGDASSRDWGGCGCAHGQGSAGWLALGLAGLLARRRS